MKLPAPIAAILQEPPPSMAFEISEAGISVARLAAKMELDFRPLKPGVLAITPLKDNVVMPDELSIAVRELAPQNGNRKRRDVALILPDYSSRIAVLDFDNFPSDTKEQLSLIRFRIKKSVPFDVESDRKSTRLNSSHLGISYAVFCLKKKQIKTNSSCTVYVLRHPTRRRQRHGPH